MEIKFRTNDSSNDSQKIYLPLEEALCFIKEHKNECLFCIRPTQTVGNNIVYEVEFTSQYC